MSMFRTHAKTLLVPKSEAILTIGMMSLVSTPPSHLWELEV